MSSWNVAALLVTVLTLCSFCRTEAVTWWCANNTANHGTYISSHKVDSMEECKTRCAPNPECRSVLLKQSNKYCYLMRFNWANRDRYTNDSSWNLCEKATPGRCLKTPGLCSFNDTCVDLQFGKYECQKMRYLCYDATGEIDGGRVDCELSYASDINRYQYHCKLSCIPGYHAAPAPVATCTNVDAQQADIPPAPRFYASETFAMENASCSLPTECPAIGKTHLPEHGDVDCHDEGEKKICVRRCQFPYVPTEPEFVEEFCGPDTQFFWSHVLRNNDTKMPPCKMNTECSTIDTKLEHGRLICHEDTWALSSACKLQCDPGYVSITRRNNFFCGPNTAFRWSNEWPNVTGISNEIGCKESPFTVVITFSPPCHIHQKQNFAEVFMKAFGSTKGPLLWELVNWDTVCHYGKGFDQDMQYFFNFKDLCIEGTCRDSCKVYLMHNATELAQCLEMCNEDFMKTDSALTQMRRIITNYIARSLESTKSDITGLFRNYGLKSMVVKVADVNNNDGQSSDLCR